MKEDKKHVDDHFIDIPVDFMEDEEQLEKINSFNEKLKNFSKEEIEILKEIVKQEENSSQWKGGGHIQQSSSQPTETSASTVKKVHFEIEAPFFKTEYIQNVILPKFILSDSSNTKINEKGMLLLHFTNKNSSQIYPALMNAIKNGISHLKIKISIEDSDDVVWQFKNPRIQAADFGVLSLTEEPNNFCAEINYDSFCINGVEI